MPARNIIPPPPGSGHLPLSTTWAGDILCAPEPGAGKLLPTTERWQTSFLEGRLQKWPASHRLAFFPAAV